MDTLLACLQSDTQLLESRPQLLAFLQWARPPQEDILEQGQLRRRLERSSAGFKEWP